MTAAHDLSLGEFRALVAKAFRGAGYSWGLTEDASFAAKRLAEFGLPAADIVALLLSEVDGRDLTSLMPSDLVESGGGITCPICVGVSLADERTQLVRSGSSIANVVAPVLAVPLLAMGLRPGDRSTCLIEWNDGSCAASSSSIVVSGTLPDRAVDVHISVRENTIDAVEQRARVELQPAIFEALQEFAQRTYVPASEASRLAGAGPS